MMLMSPDNNEGIKVEVKTSSGSYPTRLPATVAAESSNEGVQVTVIDKCYDRTVTNINKGVTPSYWANLLNGWGFLIDWATGKMWKYDTSTYVVLNKKTGCVEKSTKN